MPRDKDFGKLLTGPMPDPIEPDDARHADIEYRDAEGITVYLYGYWTCSRAESSYGQPVYVVTGGPRAMPYPVGSALGPGDIAAIGGVESQPLDDGPVVGYS